MLNILLYGYGYGGMGYGGLGYYGFDWTYIFIVIGAVFSMWASSKVKTTFKKYSSVMARCGYTSQEVARKMLDYKGVYDVHVEHISGSLTDHFDPSAKVLRLSDSVYGSQSIAAIAVAAHECGHAIQKNESYFPMTVRSSFVGAANFGSKFGIPALVGGAILGIQPLIVLGIILFSFGFLFHVITLPVEFDASRRAIKVLDQMGIFEADEKTAGEKVLKAAALTYVAAAAASLLSLLRLIIRFGGNRRRR